jgi:hypothetical protein
MLKPERNYQHIDISLGFYTLRIFSLSQQRIHSLPRKRRKKKCFQVASSKFDVLLVKAKFLLCHKSIKHYEND